LVHRHDRLCLLTKRRERGRSPAVLAMAKCSIGPGGTGKASTGDSLTVADLLTAAELLYIWLSQNKPGKMLLMMTSGIS
jgi:hypothetical protein